MRSVFPALQDRHLKALLCGAVALLVVAIVAIVALSTSDDEVIPVGKRRAMIRVTGASPAN